MKLSPEAATAKGRVIGLQRCRPADDPAVTAARVALKAIRAEDYVRELVDTFPPLSPAQRDKLAALLRPAPLVEQDGLAG